MRKQLFNVLLAIFFLAGVAFAETPGYRQDPGTGDILGQGKYQSDAHKIFRMVRYVPVTYDGATTLAADSIVVWNLVSDDGVTITTSTTSYDSAIAGITVTQALTPDTDGNTAVQDVGQGNWTWLQTYGSCQVNLATSVTPVTAGDAMATSTVAGESAPFVSSTTNARAQGNAGFFYDAATAGDNDVQCFLSLD